MHMPKLRSLEIPIRSVQSISSALFATSEEQAVQAPATVATEQSLLPTLILNGVTLVWGSQHAVIKNVIDEGCSPGLTNFARFAIAAACFCAWTPGLLKQPPQLPFTAKDPQTSGKPWPAIYGYC
jgi:hypothetical protein